MYSNKANSTCRLVSQLRRQISSALRVLKMERVNATGPSKHATLDGGIVETIALAAHRNLEVVSAQELLIVVAAILRASVSVVNAARWRLAQVDGHLQRPDREVAFHPVADGPTDHAPGIKIDDHGEVKPALTSPDIADITGPFLVVSRKWWKLDGGVISG